MARLRDTRSKTNFTLQTPARSMILVRETAVGRHSLVGFMETIKAYSLGYAHQGGAFSSLLLLAQSVKEIRV